MFNGILSAGAARRPALAGDAVPDHLVQRHPPPRHRPSRRRASPASPATSTATPTAPSSSRRIRDRTTPACASTRRPCAATTRQLLFSSKRSIRTMDHFAEVEEYFDGDTGDAGRDRRSRSAEGADQSHGRLQRHHRLSAGAEARRAEPPHRRPGDAAGAARRGAVQRQGAVRRLPSARWRSSPTTPCTTSRSSASTPAGPRDRSRPSRCAASRTRRPICTTAAC